MKTQFDDAVSGLTQRLCEDRAARLAAEGAVLDDDEVVELVRTEISARLTRYEDGSARTLGAASD